MTTPIQNISCLVLCQSVKTIFAAWRNSRGEATETTQSEVRKHSQDDKRLGWLWYA